MRISDWSSDVCSSDLDHGVLRSPERIGVGEIAVLAEQVGNDRKPARLDIEQRMIDLDRRAPEQPFLQLMAGRAISVGVVIKDKPRLLLALARQGQVTHGRDVYRLVPVEGAGARQEIAGCERSEGRAWGKERA